jgi:hypothetical protein
MGLLHLCKHMCLLLKCPKGWLQVNSGASDTAETFQTMHSLIALKLRNQESPTRSATVISKKDHVLTVNQILTAGAQSIQSFRKQFPVACCTLINAAWSWWHTRSSLTHDFWNTEHNSTCSSKTFAFSFYSIGKPIFICKPVANISWSTPRILATVTFCLLQKSTSHISLCRKLVQCDSLMHS